MADAYRKVGRGGAGNYYNQQDIKAAKKKAKSQIDLEAQNPTAGKIHPEDTTTARKLQTSGRGGAGNVTDPKTLAAGTKRTVDVTAALQESKASEAGHYGRGGAGNYRMSAEGPPAPVEREMKEMKRPATYWEAEADVEAGLQEPAKAHLGTERFEAV